jgi:hypothetical protein
MANQMAYLKTNIVAATHLAATASFNNIYDELAVAFNVISGSHVKSIYNGDERRQLRIDIPGKDQRSPSFPALDVPPLTGNPSSRTRT